MIEKNTISLFGVDWAYLSWNLVDGFLELPAQNWIAVDVSPKTFNRGHFLDTSLILLHCLESVDILNERASIHKLWFLYSFGYHIPNKLFIYIIVPSYSVIKVYSNQFWKKMTCRLFIIFFIFFYLYLIHLLFDLIDWVCC